MLACWQPEPKDRPTFEELNKELQKLLNDARSLLGESESINEKAEMDEDDDEEDDIEIYIPNQVITADV